MIEAICIALIAFAAYREYANAKERQSLLNRIQAPEVVVAQQVAPNLEAPDPIPADMGPWAQPRKDDDE